MGNWTKTAAAGGVGDIAPAAVTITGAEYEYIGPRRVRVRIAYTPPSDPLFLGVHIWEESPDQSSAVGTPLDGTQQLDGTANLGGEWKPADLGRFTAAPAVFELDVDGTAITKRFYLASYSGTASADLVRATLPSPTPSAVVTISPASYQSGVEYAPLVTGVSVSVEYDDTQVASPKYRLRFQWSAPTETPAVWQQPFGGTQLVYEYADGRRANGPSMALNETDTRSDWYDLYNVTSVIQCWFVSYDNSETPRVNSIVDGVTPSASATVTFPVPGRPTGQPFADNVTDFAVFNPRYVTNSAGQKSLLMDWYWTRPSDPSGFIRWGGAIIYLYLPDGSQPIQCTGMEAGYYGTLSFAVFPAATEVWTFRAISFDNNNNPNNYNPNAPLGTDPVATISVAPPAAGAAGSEYTSMVTGASFAAAVVNDSNGAVIRRVTASFTQPSDPTWGGVEARVYDGATLIDKASSKVSPVAVTVPNPASSVNYTVKLVSYDVNGRSNSETGAPQGTVLVGAAAGTLDFRKYDPASTLILDIDPGTGKTTLTSAAVKNSMIDRLSPTGKLIVVNADIATNAILANNIAAGVVSSDKLDATAVNVGGGGSKPGKFAVFNASGSQIGFIGVESGNEGAWFKTMRVGGTSYANGILQADAAGNVTMNGATFTLNLNGTTTAIQNTLDSNLSEYVGCKVRLNTGGYSTVTPLGFNTFHTDDATVLAAIQRSGSAGTLSLKNSTLTNSITATASTPRIVVSDPTFSTTINAGQIVISGNQVLQGRGAAVTAVSGTATAAYTATEQAMLNDLKTAVNAVISRMQAHGLIS